MSRSYLRKLFLLLSAGAATLASNASAQDIQVVTYTNTTWIYNDSSTAANNPGTAWKEPGFVPVIGSGENEWKANGKGLFGNDTSAVYNEPNDPFRGGTLGFATPLDRGVVGGTGTRITFYFITKFNWPYDPAGVILRGTNYLDDSAIVYLNGVEVFRSRVPGTVGVPPDWTQLGDNQGNEGVPEPLEYSATSLVTGENVLAVELHQSSAGSSDVAFATALRAVIPFAPTILTPNEPADRAVVENRKTTLSVSADGSPRPTYQWYKDGDAIPGATSNSYTIAKMTAGDAGIYKVILNNEFGSATSRDANVTFTDDVAPPTVVRAAQAGAFNLVTVTFDELVELDSAQNQFTYFLTDGVNGEIAPITVTLNPDGSSVLVDYGVDLLPGTLYTMTVFDVADIADPINPMPAQVQVQFTTWVPSDCGGVLFETFDTEGGSLTAISALTGHPNYPNNPRESFRLNSFSTREVYTDDSHENYGGRMRALFIPPTSGNWVFYLSSDDAGQLFLNPNGPGEGGKILVQDETGCCNPYASHATAPYALEGGKAYYLEAIYKEGGGGDYCHVWAGPEGVAPPAAAAASLTPADAIPGSMLGAPAAPLNAAGTFTITQQPANQSAVPNSSATFSVTTSTDALLCYQWLRDGVEIANGKGSSYSLTATPADSGAKFSVRISIIGGNTVTSSEATLTVEEDTIRPTVVSATTDTSGANVIVTFSEPMGASAASAANYTINGVNPASATQTSPTVVTLAAASPVQDCVRNAVVITGVADTSANPINPNPTTINFTKPQILVANSDAQIWRYEDTGADLGVAWRESAFDDSGWASGAGPFAFPADEAMPAGWTTRTPLVNWVAARNTMYFRTKFNFASAPASVTRLQLNRVVDDGAIFWINGKQLNSLRCDANSGYATLANASPAEPQTVESIDVPAADLVYGENVLAVEVHQSATTSSDVVFGAEMIATISACVPPLTVTRAGSQVILAWPDPSFTLEKSSSVTGPWAPQAGASGVSLPASPNNAFFRLVKP